MKIVLQRVKNAKVTIDNSIYSQINCGLLVFYCAEKGDKQEFIEFLAKKVLNLRIFEDENEKMNLSVKDIEGEILAVSQFTLSANCKKGLRPSFDKAMEPICAKEFYQNFIDILKKSNLNIQTGIFGADMKIELLNDGPITILLDSDKVI